MVKREKINSIIDEPCAIESGMRLIGGKWKASIIYHLKDEPVRFNDLARMLGGASKKIVDQRLKELENEGIVLRKVVSDGPTLGRHAIASNGFEKLVCILIFINQWLMDLKRRVANALQAIMM